MNRFIPLKLNNDTLADGEKAVLLSLVKIDAGPVPGAAVPLYAAPAATRVSRMRMAGILQIDELVDPLQFLLQVRSPFTANQGLPTMAPIVRASYFDANASGASVITWPSTLLGDPNILPVVPNTPSLPWSTTDAVILPGNYFETFNGKAIPNWAFGISVGYGEVSNVQVFLEVDFGHSIT